MTLSLVQLLLYEDDVPAVARLALRRASDASTCAARHRYLEAAAALLSRDTELDFADARELVGLSDAPAPAIECARS